MGPRERILTPSIESARPYYVEVEEVPSFELLCEPVDTGQEVPAGVGVAVLSALIPYSRAESSGSVASQVAGWQATLQQLANRLREQRQEARTGLERPGAPLDAYCKPSGSG